MAKEIFIYRGYSDGRLDLSDDGYSEVRIGRKIKWKIDNQPEPNSIEIVSIESMTAKQGSNFGIFTAAPSKDGTEWKAKVKDENEVKGHTCEYWIRWVGQDGVTRDCDPIIAVKPTAYNEQSLIVGIATVVVALVTFQLLWKKNRMKSAFNRTFPR